MGSLRVYVIASALVCTILVAWADDPPAATPPSSQAQQSSHSSSSSASKQAPQQALDLRTPDVHKVIPPEELQAAVNAPDEDEASVPCLPVAEDKGDGQAHHCGLACFLDSIEPTHAAAALVVSVAIVAANAVHPPMALSTCPASTP
jgi:hypothetical protein